MMPMISKKRLSQYFFRGLIAVLPLGLTVYLLYLFVSFLESMAMFVIRPIVGDFYLPGLGIALAVLAILAMGFLLSQVSCKTIVPIPYFIGKIKNSLFGFLAYHRVIIQCPAYRCNRYIQLFGNI